MKTSAKWRLFCRRFTGIYKSQYRYLDEDMAPADDALLQKSDLTAVGQQSRDFGSRSFISNHGRM